MLIKKEREKGTDNGSVKNAKITTDGSDGKN